jgi:hypothetical protein
MGNMLGNMLGNSGNISFNSITNGAMNNLKDGMTNPLEARGTMSYTTNVGGTEVNPGMLAAGIFGSNAVSGGELKTSYFRPSTSIGESHTTYPKHLSGGNYKSKRKYKKRKRSKKYIK